jgi:c-di-GMP-binding flagellar brake protein YcgR
MWRDIDLTVLSEAAARNVPLVLSISSGGALQHFKSRFLQISQGGIWIDSVPAEKALLAKLSAHRLGVAVAFKSGTVSYLFTTNVASAVERLRLHADTASVLAMRLELPHELKTIQRRAAYRTRVRPEDLSFAAWRVGPDADLTDNPVASQQLNVQPRDISLGGIGVLLRPVWGEPPVVTPGERLRTELASSEGKILLEGRLRGGRSSKEAGGVIAGIQWVLPQDHLKAAQITGHLERLVNRLQRQELRRGKPPNLRIA